MKWFKRLARVLEYLDRVTPFEFVRVIADREDPSKPYLIRYYLLSSRWLQPIFPRLSYRLTLHHILRSDMEGLHDHPWTWGRRLISGGYWERTPDGRFWRSAQNGWNWFRATDFHRLEIDPYCPDPTWSLFVMGPKERDWGFLDEESGTWMTHDAYIAKVRGLNTVPPEPIS